MNSINFKKALISFGYKLEQYPENKKYYSIKNRNNETLDFHYNEELNMLFSPIQKSTIISVKINECSVYYEGKIMSIISDSLTLYFFDGER